MKLNELVYPGNIGVMEMVKFYKTCTPEQKLQMKQLLADHKQDEAWALLKQVTGADLK